MSESHAVGCPLFILNVLPFVCLSAHCDDDCRFKVSYFNFKLGNQQVSFKLVDLGPASLILDNMLVSRFVST
jgi:hypothetical protein